jgi:hypothetical protein
VMHLDDERGPFDFTDPNGFTRHQI